MPPITLAKIEERMHQLAPEKLTVVYDFVSYLLERDVAALLLDQDSDAHATLLASEAVLGRDWNRLEEDTA